MGTIIQGLFSIIWRCLCWLFIEFLIEIVRELITGYGWLTLKLLTFGRYDKSVEEGYLLCTFVGLISSLATFYSLAYLLLALLPATVN